MAADARAVECATLRLRIRCGCGTEVEHGAAREPRALMRHHPCRGRSGDGGWDASDRKHGHGSSTRERRSRVGGFCHAPQGHDRRGGAGALASDRGDEHPRFFASRSRAMRTNGPV
eukprot:1194468-Rhodomonas_salina.1